MRSADTEVEQAEEDELTAGEITEGDLKTITSESIQSLVVMPTDWTISVLIDMLKRGKIELEPEFQRRTAWTETKMSKYIESLFLGLPVPQIVLAEYKPGKFVVIDGKQRLTSLARFCIENTKYPALVLKGCDYKTALNGKTFAALSADDALTDDVDAFLSHTIRTIVLKQWESEELIYLMFLRLNQNSVSLSPQELRRALHPGPFYKWLDDWTANSKAMTYIFNQVPDFRMRDMEVCLRFMAFQLFSTRYAGNMKLFLDFTSQYFSSTWPEHKEVAEDSLNRFSNSIEATVSIFQDHAFQVFSEGRYQPSHNRAVIDIMTYYFADEEIRRESLRKADAVKLAYEQTCQNNATFVRYLQSTTKSKTATSGRFEIWRATLGRVLGVDLPTAGIPQ